MKSWPENEVEVLRQLYPKETKTDILRALPKRNWIAIAHKASRLGITREDVYWVQEQERNCKWCGEVFLSKQNMKWGWSEFCSEKCRLRFYHHEKHGFYTQATKTCPVCGKFFVTTKPKLQKYCSRECGYEEHKRRMRQWKRDHPEEKKRRDHLHYIKYKHLAIKQAREYYGTVNCERNGICSIPNCNKKSRAAHHLIPRWLTHDDEADNLIETCMSHHRGLDNFIREFLLGKIDNCIGYLRTGSFGGSRLRREVEG